VFLRLFSSAIACSTSGGMTELPAEVELPTVEACDCSCPVLVPVVFVLPVGPANGRTLVFIDSDEGKWLEAA